MLMPASVARITWQAIQRCQCTRQRDSDQLVICVLASVPFAYHQGSLRQHQLRKIAAKQQPENTKKTQANCQYPQTHRVACSSGGTLLKVNYSSIYPSELGLSRAR